MLHKVVLTFESVDKTLVCDHSNECYWSVLSCATIYYAVQCKVVLNFMSDETLVCDHSNESYWTVLSCGTVYALQGDVVLTIKSWNEAVACDHLSMLTTLQNVNLTFKCTCTGFLVCHHNQGIVQILKFLKAGNSLRISIVGTAPFIITVMFTAGRVSAGNGLRKQNSADHSWHHHDKNWQDLQKSSKDWTCFGMDVVLCSKGTLHNDLW